MVETNFKPEPVKAETDAGYIKLMKSETSKGVVSYGWDIKIIEGKDPEPLKKALLDLQEIHEQMERTFVSQSSN